MSATATPQEPPLNWFFSAGGRHSLLTREQEAQLDGDKWAAVENTWSVLCEYPGGRALLLAVAAQCGRAFPSIESIESRDKYFLLRREFEAYFPDGDRAGQMAALPAALASADTAWQQLRQNMALPASLVIGMAQFLLRQQGVTTRCAVADAIQAWSGNWPQVSLANLPLDDIADALTPNVLQFNAAREALTLHNLRLVYTIAARYRELGTPITDLVQEGTLGLIRAAEKFDHRQGNRFSTYAYNWITQAVRRFLCERGNLISYPGQVQDQVNRVHRERLALIERIGREPSTQQLAQAAHLSPARVNHLQQLGNITLSLDEPLGEDEGSRGDFLADEQAEPTARGTELQSLKQCLVREIDTLAEDERTVMMNRWGLLPGRPLSRAELAQNMSISREWVRQLEISAMDKLRRKPMVREAFRDHCQDPDTGDPPGMGL